MKRLIRPVIVVVMVAVAGRAGLRETEQRGGLLPQGVGAHAATFLMARDTTPMHRRTQLARLGEELLGQHLVWQDALQEHAFVLGPIPP
jgi:hypothetical protein